MIKINLLPVKEEKLAAAGKGFLLVAVILTVLVVSSLIFNSTLLAASEKEAEEKISEADKEIAKIKNIIQKVKELKGKRKQLKNKIDMIVALKKDNVGPVRVLDELSLKLPSNKIWLESLSLKGGNVEVTGKTIENQEVATLMNQLESSIYFSLPELQKLEKSSGGKKDVLDVNQFSIRGKAFLSGDEDKKSKE